MTEENRFYIVYTRPQVVGSKHFFARVIIIVTSFMLFGFQSAYGQGKGGYVCSLDSGPISVDAIKSKLKEIDLNEKTITGQSLQGHFIEAARVLHFGYTEFNIFTLESGPKIACSYNDKIGTNFRAVIVCNWYAYYYGVGSWATAKAAILWIMGHEITHHINADVYYGNDDRELKNYCKELICDENAGYLLAKLSACNFEHIPNLLSKILTDRKNSKYYPELKYRIYAAQAGWLRGTSEIRRKDKSEFWIGAGKKASQYLRRDTTQQKIIIEGITTIEKNDSLETIREEYSNGNIFFGHSRQNKTMDGVKIFVDDEASSGENFNPGIFTKIQIGIFKNGELISGKTINARSICFVNNSEAKTNYKSDCQYYDK